MPAMDLGRTGGKTTSGEDIRGTLSQMAEQIAEAERRHLAQMRDMQQRLSELTSQAERTTAELPAINRFEPATVETRKTLARIGDGIAGLQARTAEPVAAASVVAQADDAWDMASAEALTRMYESETPHLTEPAPAFFLQDPLPAERALKAAVVHDAVQSLKHATPLKTIRVAPDPAPAPSLTAARENLSSLAVDRAWLDQRIEDIAARVEDTLARNNPMDRIVDLDRRFGAFEESFGQAMAEVATRADLEGLRVIEGDIAELAKRLDDTRQSLSRIDGIEAELRTLSAIAEQAQTADPAMDAANHAAPAIHPEMPDVAALVESTAERVAERFAAAAPHAKASAADGPRFDEMQAMIATIAEERRREEHQTASMLDTMQEALVRLIDRVDQLDRSAGQPATAAAAAEAAAPVTAAAPAPEPIVYVENERGPHPGRRATDHEAYVHSGVRHHDPELPEVPVPAAAAGIASAAEQAEPRLRQRSARQPTPAAPAAAPTPPPRARVAEPAAPPKPDSRPSPRQLAQPTVIAMPDEAPEEEKEQSSLAKRGILVAGIGIAIIALGLLFEFFIKDRLLAPGTPRIAERAPITRPVAATPAARDEAPAMTPRFADEAEGPTPAATRQGDGTLQKQPDPREAPAPASGKGASDQPPANQQPRPRSQLETSTDQPRQAVAQIPATAPVASIARGGPPPVTTSSVQGIALQHSGPISMTPPGTPPAMAPQQPQQPQAPKQAGGITTSALPQPAAPTPLSPSGAAVELPPALIGPLSLRLAAQKGDPEAQFEVAARFAEGKGVKQDFKQALTWYERSAQSGFIPSQYRLGTLFERGVSGKPDVATARQWYERAANQGNVKAMHNLAVLAASAQNGQTPDYATAAQWFGAAAERGLADSQFNLGVLHENGLGVERDNAAAYKWYALAAAKGDAEATKRRDAVFGRLLPGQALALSDEVAKWRAKPTSAAANDARAAGAAVRARAEMASAASADDHSARQVPTPAKRITARPNGQPALD